MQSMSGLFILPIIAVALFMIFRKRKNSDSQNILNNRANKKDEVWRTIKSFLKSNNEYGKEIVSSFVAKRPCVFNKSATKKKFYQEIKASIRAQNMNRKQARIFTKKMRKEQLRELYCILFITRDAKTKLIDHQRIIEAEVKYIFVKKNERKRDIKINGLVDFKKNFEWMKPLKEKEDKQLQKVAQRNKIAQEKKARIIQRKNERKRKKANKKNGKSVS